jgi:LPS-assembly lipoprotein
MWWRERRIAGQRLAQLVIVLAAASLTAGCFQPLYGDHPTAGGDSVHEKLSTIDIPPIPARQGTPQGRIAVAVHNALQYNLNGGAGPSGATYRLQVTVNPADFSTIIDVKSGLPTAQIGGVSAHYQLVEIATGRLVVNDSTTVHVDYDIPGAQQRFSKQRAQINAEDQAVQAVAENIRNRLASYFVAGT